MITVISTTRSAAKTLTYLDKTKYQLLMLFSDALDNYHYKDYNTYLIGKKILYGHGTKQSFDLAKKGFLESINDIIAKVQGEKVVLVGFLGGAMSIGIGMLAKELLGHRKNVKIIVTFPLEFEGPGRIERANQVINDLINNNLDYKLVSYSIMEKTIMANYEYWDKEIAKMINDISNHYEIKGGIFYAK